MKKRDVTQYLQQHSRHFKTAEYVVAHAKWQKSRGRRPSETYMGETNPRKALEFALLELRSYKPLVGEDVQVVAERMSSITGLTGAPCVAYFNDIKLVANPGDSAKSIFTFYFDESERLGQAFLASPEGYARQAEQERNLQQAHKTVQEAMSELPTLDFTNMLEVVNWLGKIRTPSSMVEVPHQEIVETFRRNGFEARVNLGDDFNGEDEENFARWLIGQALRCLQGADVGGGTTHSIHQVYMYFAEEWREKFGHPAV